MITVDTNVVLRLIMADDADKLERTLKLISASGGAVLQPSVVLELAWVLQRRLGQTAPATAAILATLATTDGIVAPAWVSLLPRAVSAGLEIDDAVHLLTANETHSFATFDALLHKRAPRVFAKPEVVTP